MLWEVNIFGCACGLKNAQINWGCWQFRNMEIHFRCADHFISLLQENDFVAECRISELSQAWKMCSTVLLVFACTFVYSTLNTPSDMAILYHPCRWWCKTLMDVTRCRLGSLAGRILVSVIYGILLGSRRCPLWPILGSIYLFSWYCITLCLEMRREDTLLRWL